MFGVGLSVVELSELELYELDKKGAETTVAAFEKKFLTLFKNDNLFHHLSRNTDQEINWISYLAKAHYKNGDVQINKKRNRDERSEVSWRSQTLFTFNLESL
ncbi:hypothetical protein BXO87_01975 [Bacillus sp. GZB]|nr:hypothetical protein BXO87_01975 [Bacillus sp. GZB]